MLCRLCGSTNNTAQQVSYLCDTYTHISTILPEITFSDSEKIVTVCGNCIWQLKRFFSFRDILMETQCRLEKWLRKLNLYGTKNYLNLKDILKWEHEVVSEETFNSKFVCRVCLNYSDYEHSVDLNEGGEYSCYISSCFPSLNLEISETLHCCKSCSENIKELYNYRKVCLEVNERLTGSSSDGDSKVIMKKENDAIDSQQITKICGISILKEDKSSDQKEGTEIQEKSGQEKEDESFFRCPHCIYNTINEAGLIAHLKFKHFIYEDDERLKCPDCPIQCRRAPDLRRHMLLRHNKPYERYITCRKCKFKTNNRTDMKLHMEELHPPDIREDVSCPHCSFSTKNKFYLKKHVEKKHADK